MDENRYHEILPVAYMAAAFRSGGKPSPRDVGLSARAIEAVENPKSAAYRIALATAFPVTIVSVKRVTVSLGNGQGGKPSTSSTRSRRSRSDRTSLRRS